VVVAKSPDGATTRDCLLWMFNVNGTRAHSTASPRRTTEEPPSRVECRPTDSGAPLTGAGDRPRSVPRPGRHEPLEPLTNEHEPRRAPRPTRHEPTQPRPKARTALNHPGQQDMNPINRHPGKALPRRSPRAAAASPRADRPLTGRPSPTRATRSSRPTASTDKTGPDQPPPARHGPFNRPRPNPATPHPRPHARPANENRGQSSTHPCSRALTTSPWRA
jgi:hypothetical protein